MSTKISKKTKTKEAVIVAALTKKANPLKKRVVECTIATPEQRETVALNIKNLKAMKKEGKKELDAIIDPIEDSIQRIKNLFQPLFDLVDETERVGKAEIDRWDKAVTAKLEAVKTKIDTGKVSVNKGLTLLSALTGGPSKASNKAKVWVATVEDVTKVPREFMEVNMTAVREACRAGKVPKGIKWEQVSQTRI